MNADEESSDLPDVGDVNHETDAVVKKRPTDASSKSSRKSKRDSDGSADDNDDLPRYFLFFVFLTKQNVSFVKKVV